MTIPSSYAKILGETKFQLREFRRSLSKAMSIEEREKERAKVSDNNGQYIRLDLTITSLSHHYPCL